jgi:hypothetical protein
MVHSVLLLLVAFAQSAQTNTGELRIAVTDSAGLPLPGPVQLVSDANQIREQLETDAQGVIVAKRLPFGTYRIAVTRDGFAPFTRLIDIHTSLPTDYRATMTVAPLQAQIDVRAEDTLLDLHQTTTVHRIGVDLLQQRATALPGRSLPDLVNTQPGWLLEANGILHPRGSEYQTQYVFDGLPLTDTRSAAFASEIDADEIHALSISHRRLPGRIWTKAGRRDRSGHRQQRAAGLPRKRDRRRRQFQHGER